MSSEVNRRNVLKAGGATAVAAVGMAALSGKASAAPADALAAPSDSAVFRHGIASGDPLPNSVLLWTRVTPSPEATPGSGLGQQVDVHWEIATKPTFEFGTVLNSGRRSTGPNQDHTVKVDAIYLNPDTVYYYRFRFGDAVSATGRTKTAPQYDADVARLRFGVVSCSNWQAGFFTPYRYLAERGDLDAVLHLGDYIYEYKVGQYPEKFVRKHEPEVEAVTLTHYRQRYAQYKTDPDLQALHAACPWIVTWDDHEVANDAWTDGAQNHNPEEGEGDFATRKTGAHRAYFEWMPVRNAGDRLYRRFQFGKLAELSMLDLRSYRSKQVPPKTDEDKPDRTITGTNQMNWLIEGVISSEAQWKLVGNPVMLTPLDFPVLPAPYQEKLVAALGFPPGSPVVFTDQWDGYTADRAKLMKALRVNKITDTVFLTGDIHSSWATDVPADPATYPATGESVATELICTSVTSDNIDDLTGLPPRNPFSLLVEGSILKKNTHIKYVEYDSHGASVLEVTPQGTQMDWYYVRSRAEQNSPIHYAKSFRVTAGTQKVSPSTTPIGQ